jgi:WD40 repeat protein
MYVRVTDLSNGKAVHEFSIRPAGLSFPAETSYDFDAFASGVTFSAVLSPDGSRLCLQGLNNYQLFDTATGKVAVSLDTQPNRGGAPAFSPDGTQLLIVGRGKIVEIPIKGGGTRIEPAMETPLACFDAKIGQKRWEVKLLTGSINRLAYAPDGRTFAVHSRDSGPSVEFRDAATGNLLGRLDKLPMGAYDVAFTPDGNRIILTMMDGTVLLYNVPDFRK